MTKRFLLGALFIIMVPPAALAAEACAGADGLTHTAFRGAIYHPVNFVHPFGDGYRFELMPVDYGWDIGLFDGDGNAVNVFVPASGIAQENPRALLGRHFADPMRADRQRRFAFGEDARNPELYPELNIVPGAPGGAAGNAPPPRFGQGELQVWGFRTETNPDAGEPVLRFLDFEACLLWIPVANEIAEEGGPPPEVDFPGFDPVERIFEEAVIQFHTIADQLRLAERGEIDGDTALERIGDLREILTEIRRRWREADPAQRTEARMRRLSDLEQAETRIIEATDAYAQKEGGPDFRILHMLQEPPFIGDFLREPAVETFQGLYRRGFEASDFYLFDGEGPWWLESTTEVWDQLQSHMVERPGRGSSVTVALTVTGWQESEGGYGGFGRYETRIYVESIDAIRPITEDEYWTAVNITRQ